MKTLPFSMSVMIWMWYLFLHSLRHLNYWSGVGDTVWEGFGGVVVLEEVCHWGLALQLQSLLPSPDHGLSCLWFEKWVSACCHAFPLWCCGLLSFCKHVPQINRSFCKLPWPYCFIIAVGRWLIQQGFSAVTLARFGPDNSLSLLVVLLCETESYYVARASLKKVKAIPRPQASDGGGCQVYATTPSFAVGHSDCVLQDVQ